MARAAVGPSVLVLDASLAVKLVLPEPYSDAARELIFGSEFAHLSILAPVIIMTEVTAAITKSVRSRTISSATARAAFATWKDLVESVFREVTLLNNIDEAFELSLRLHHGLHDCLYLALAQSRDAVLATCDGVLAHKARRIGAVVRFVGAE